MGLLNWYFSDERKAKKALYSDKQIEALWKEYIQSFRKKKEIAQSLTPNDLTPLKSLSMILKKEFYSFKEDDEYMKEMIAEVSSLSHSERMKRLKRMGQCLDYEKTRLEYVHYLTMEIGDVLLMETNYLKKMMKDGRTAKDLVPPFIKEVQLEEKLIEKINKITLFHPVFVSLARDEHLFRMLDERKGSLRKRMWGRMFAEDRESIFGGGITEGVTYEWAMKTLEMTKNAISEAHASESIDSHPDYGYEFVNRPEFLEVVKTALLEVRGRGASQKLILVFTNHFRSWFNYCWEGAAEE